MNRLATGVIAFLLTLGLGCSAGGGRFGDGGGTVQPLQMAESQYGVQLLEAKPTDGGWLVKGRFIGPQDRPLYWRVDFVACTGVALPSDAEWTACSGKAVRIQPVTGGTKFGVIRSEDSRVWVQAERSDRVVTEGKPRTRWIADAGTDRSRRWVIVIGTNAMRVEHPGEFAIPLPSPKGYSFTRPRDVVLEALSLPDLKPIGPQVTLLDSDKAFTEGPSSSGWAGIGPALTAEGIPGVAIVRQDQIWWIGEHMFHHKEKP